MPVSLVDQKAPVRALSKWLAVGLLLVLGLFTARLGLWQLDRADEKRDLAQKRQLAASKAPAAVEHLAAEDLPALEGQGLRLRLSQSPNNWYLDSRSYKGQAGMYVLAVVPLSLPRAGYARDDARSASHVLLLRGWQAKDPRQAQGIQERGTIQAGESLLVRVESEREHAASRLGLGDRVAGDHLRHWLVIDSQVMGEKSGMRLAPFVLRQLEAAVDAKGQAVEDGLIRDWPEPADGVQKHKAYALQWFLFCTLSWMLALAIALRWRVTDPA